MKCLHVDMCACWHIHVYVGYVTVRFVRLVDALQRFFHFLCLLEELLKPLETSSLIQNRLMFSHFFKKECVCSEKE